METAYLKTVVKVPSIVHAFSSTLDLQAEDDLFPSVLDENQ